MLFLDNFLRTLDFPKGGRELSPAPSAPPLRLHGESANISTPVLTLRSFPQPPRRTGRRLVEEPQEITSCSPHTSQVGKWVQRPEKAVAKTRAQGDHVVHGLIDAGYLVYPYLHMGR